MGLNGKITVGFVVVCTAAIFAAIGMCAMERVQTASFIGMVAAGLSVIGLYFAFESWKEKPVIKKASPESVDAKATAHPSPAEQEAQASPVISRAEDSVARGDEQ